MEFASWLLNTLHGDLTGGKRKKASIITRCFQGELEVTTLAGTGATLPLRLVLPCMSLSASVYLLATPSASVLSQCKPQTT